MWYLMSSQHDKVNNPTPDKYVLAEPSSSGSNSSTPRKPLDLESWSKMMALLGILSYVVGLLGVNMYLYQLGVSDFSLWKPRFILTGFLALLLSVLGFVCPFLGAWYMFFGNEARVKTRQVLTNNRIKIFLLRAFCSINFWSREFWKRWWIGLIFFLAPLIVFSFFAWTGGSNTPWTIGLSMYASSLSVGILGAAIVYGGRIENRKVTPKLEPLYRAGRTGLSCVFATLFFILFLALFAQYVFPVLPEQFGGGKPKQIRILFEKDSLLGAEQIGIPIMPNKQVSEPVNLLFEGTDSYILRLPNNQVVQIDRKATQGIQVVTN
jgi:hypothetical protein